MPATIRKVAVDPAPSHPGRPRRRSTADRVVRAVLAVAVPVAWAIALIPVRDELTGSLVLLMVVPVLVIAVAGGTGPGALAACAAAASYGLFHTRPYGLPRIDDPDDVVETLVLLGVGLMIGLLVDAARGARGASQVRRTEVAAFGGVLRAFADGTAAELVASTTKGIADVLDAAHVEWYPGSPGGALAALTSDGTVRLVDGQRSSVVTTLDASELPPVVEIAAGVAGRFVVTSAGAHTSLEQRRAAFVLATAAGRWLAR